MYVVAESEPDINLGLQKGKIAQIHVYKCIFCTICIIAVLLI